MENQIITSIILTILGLMAGSFAGATIWRLRARQLRLDAKAGEKIKAADKHQVAKLQHAPLHKDRSVCLHCGHELQWYDLIPLVSWMSLGGKCRYCHAPIGWLEPALELGMAVFFVGSYLLWPVDLASTVELFRFVVWLVAGVGLAMLFVYDMKWYLLPNVMTFPLIGLGLVYSATVIVVGKFAPSVIMSIVLSCAILSGLYYVIYVFSKRQWVGFGDVKLGLALALLLANWQLAVLTLFLANLFGTIIFMPALVLGKMKRQTRIPFGPLLISGWLVSGLFGLAILQWYLSLALGLS